jgi:hypothetical protein
MEEKSILKYFQENLSSKIREVTINKDMPLNKVIFEEIINELKALDKEKDTGNAEKEAAITLLNPQIKRGIERSNKILDDNSEMRLRDPQKHKRIMVERYSQNYSSNIPLEKYLDLFIVPSLKYIEFSPIKSSSEIDFFSDHLEYSKPHQYRIDRSDKIKIELVFRNEPYNTNTQKKPYLALVLEDGNIPKYRPSKIISKNFHLTGEEWPYPIKKRDTTNNLQGNDLKYCFKNIGWTAINLNPGEFNYDMWNLFCIAIEDHSFIKKGIALCDEYRKKINSYDKPLLITEGFEVPVGEMNLKIGTNLRINCKYPTTDIELEYRLNHSSASLYLHEVDLNPRFPKKYILEPDMY